MDTHNLRQLLRYKFDNFISSGSSSIFLSLMAVFFALLLLVGGLRVIIYLVYPEGVEQFDGAFKQIYIIFLQLTDPGNMAQDIPSSSSYKITAILAGMTGIILLSMLIAVITTALDQKLNQLKKGLSKVIEKEHTLILGWNDRVVEILRELIMANESEDNPSVVILSELEKEDMDDYLNTNLPDRENTRIITRSGTISSLQQLERVAINQCKSVIVLASCVDTAAIEDRRESDAKAIKTVLAIVTSREEDSDFNIVAEVFDQKNREIVEQVSPGDITTIDTNDILGKILVQTSRASGLAIVYSELLSFDGCEIYFYNANWRNGQFWQLQYFFKDGVPIGIRNKDGKVTINPPGKTVMRPDDDIIIVADDDSTINLESKPITRPVKHPLKQERLTPKKERNLILGWNSRASVFIRELADYVRDDSVVDVVYNSPTESLVEEIRILSESNEKLVINLHDRNPLEVETLQALDTASYDNIIILSQGGEDSGAEQTDSETIIILLLLRNIFKEHPEESANTALITEVMDSTNQELISRAGVNDFIISNRFVSNILAQVSEEADIKMVYDDLFQEDGSEIYLKPASLYFEKLPIEVKFSDLMATANLRDEICIGIRLGDKSEDMGENYGVKLIPEKNTTYLITKDDSLVVIAEDEL
jgi:hypothetical protein